MSERTGATEKECPECWGVGLVSSIGEDGEHQVDSCRHPGCDAYFRLYVLGTTDD